MPYIDQNRRNFFDQHINALPFSAGDLNFLIHELVQRYMATHPLSYETIATVTGVLENIKQEFYRRLATPYEDCKIRENGDIELYASRVNS